MMVNTLIILGGHIQALGLARQGRRKNVHVLLIIPDVVSVARFSRYVDKVLLCKNEEKLLCCLQEYSGKDTLLFPTSDEYIDFIVRHFELLKDIYTIALPELPTVELFADKTRAYRFAEGNNIPHPWCRYPQSLSEVESISRRLDYPVIIKPAIMYDFHKKFGKKALLCKSAEELRHKFKMLEEAEYPLQSLIIQEYLAGGARCLYSYGFFAVNGVVRSSIVVNRIRQNPMDFGNSTTFAITTDIPEIEMVSKRIIALTNYTGMGEIEFMFDKGEYKFLEINTRAWKWHTITNGRDFSFLGDYLDYLNGKDLSIRRKKGNREIAWVERLTDFAVILKGVFTRDVSLYEAARSYRFPKVSAVWSIRDPLPAIMYVLLSPALYIKRF